MRSALPIVLCGIAGCYSGLGLGQDDSDSAADNADNADSGAGADGDDSGGNAPAPTSATRSGLRRLSIIEYDNAVRDLIGDDSRSGAEYLPSDNLVPFDNDYVSQSPSEALIGAAEKLANGAADRLLAEPARLEALAGCTPTAADDTTCLRTLVERVGRRAFRRPLSPDELDAYAALGAIGAQADSWHTGAAAVVRGLLQDPRFLYRVEVGEPVPGQPGVIALNDYEIATRLSFFLWRTIPDDELLDLAQADGLSTQADVRATAERMLADDRARAAVKDFHALWLGYSRLATEGIAADMAGESNALVEQVVFDTDQPWLSLMTSTETFVSPTLAEHYGLPEPEGGVPGWVEYGDSGRGGIFSHGSLLALGAKFGDTSPTERGREIRLRFFCQKIVLPEGTPVNTNDPPGVDPNACKWERYAAHREEGACAGCHALMDGIGFGLENYGPSGVFREHDVDKPQCPISGDGQVAPMGTFNGPAELGALLAASEEVQTCMMTQLYRFVSGKTEPDELDHAFLQTLAEEQAGSQVRMLELMVKVAASDAIRFRVIEEGE